MRSKYLKISLFMIFLAGICLYGTGCFYIRMTEPMLRLGQERYFPKNPKFTITPDSSQAASQLAYDSIYVWERVWEHESRSYTNNFHLRFWPTGECIRFVDTDNQRFMSNPDGFYNGDMGFFNTDGTNIAIEIYVPDSYNRYYGVIHSNKIHILRIDLEYAAADRAHSSRQDRHYIRHIIGDMGSQPDWSPTGMLYKVESLPFN